MKKYLLMIAALLIGQYSQAKDIQCKVTHINKFDQIVQLNNGKRIVVKNEDLTDELYEKVVSSKEIQITQKRFKMPVMGPQFLDPFCMDKDGNSRQLRDSLDSCYKGDHTTEVSIMLDQYTGITKRIVSNPTDLSLDIYLTDSRSDKQSVFTLMNQHIPFRAIVKQSQIQFSVDCE